MPRDLFTASSREMRPFQVPAMPAGMPVTVIFTPTLEVEPAPLVAVMVTALFTTAVVG